MELKKEIKNFIDKSNNIAAGLQYLILHETTDKGVEKYKREMQALGQEDGHCVTRVRAAMLRDPKPETVLNAGPGASNNNADNLWFTTQRRRSWANSGPGQNILRCSAHIYTCT